jgi:hypothetical protein
LGSENDNFHFPAGFAGALLAWAADSDMGYTGCAQHGMGALLAAIMVTTLPRIAIRGKGNLIVFLFRDNVWLNFAMFNLALDS